MYIHQNVAYSLLHPGSEFTITEVQPGEFLSCSRRSRTVNIKTAKILHAALTYRHYYRSAKFKLAKYLRNRSGCRNRKILPHDNSMLIYEKALYFRPFQLPITKTSSHTGIETNQPILLKPGNEGTHSLTPECCTCCPPPQSQRAGHWSTCCCRYRESASGAQVSCGY